MSKCKLGLSFATFCPNYPWAGHENYGLFPQFVIFLVWIASLRFYFLVRKQEVARLGRILGSVDCDTVASVVEPSPAHQHSPFNNGKTPKTS